MDENEEELDPITKILKRPNYGAQDKYQPSFDKIERPTSKKEISNYIGRFNSILYYVFRYDDLSEFSHQIFPKIRENLIGTYNNISDEDKSYFIVDLTTDFLSGENQRLFQALKIRETEAYNWNLKLHKETKEWFKNIFNDLLNKLPSLSEKHKIRSEMLKEIIKTIENPYRFYRKTEIPSIEDICMRETETIAMLLDTLIETDGKDGLIAKQLKLYIKESGLDKLKAVDWEHNDLNIDWNNIIREQEIQIIHSDMKHAILELGNKDLIAIMDGKSTESQAKKKEEKKESIKQKEKPNEVQRHEPRIHQPQQLPQQVARPLAQVRQNQGSIQEVGNAHQAAPVTIRQPPAPPSTPSQPSILRGRPPAPSTLTTEQLRLRAEHRVARIMGHLKNIDVSAEVNKQKEELENTIEELINKDPVNAGSLINDAIEFIKEPVPQNVNITQWVNEFDKTANIWAMEFSATRNSPQRKSRLVSTFKKTFKELIKIMPNTNELFVMLVKDLEGAAQVARTNIPQVQTDLQFAKFQQNLQRYQTELIQQSAIPAIQSQRGRPQIRPSTSQQRERPGLVKPLMGGRKKIIAKTVPNKTKKLT